MSSSSAHSWHGHCIHSFQTFQTPSPVWTPSRNNCLNGGEIFVDAWDVSGFFFFVLCPNELVLHNCLQFCTCNARSSFAKRSLSALSQSPSPSFTIQSVQGPDCKFIHNSHTLTFHSRLQYPQYLRTATCSILYNNLFFNKSSSLSHFNSGET